MILTACYVLCSVSGFLEKSIFAMSSAGRRVEVQTNLQQASQYHEAPPAEAAAGLKTLC